MMSLALILKYYKKTGGTRDKLASMVAAAISDFAYLIHRNGLAEMPSVEEAAVLVATVSETAAKTRRSALEGLRVERDDEMLRRAMEEFGRGDA